MKQVQPADGNGSIHAIRLGRLNGTPASLGDYSGQVVLAVNVASKCGRTPQYGGLQALYERYAERGFTVLGFPCNQFNGEEPGTPNEIAEFCSLNYGVTFPLFEKIEVNGPNRHPLYQILTAFPHDDGNAGDIAWNFEKFLVSRDGNVARRFHYTTIPEDPQITDAIEALLK